MKRKLLIALVVLVVLLVVARIVAPYAMEWEVDRRLSIMPLYTGTVEDVDVSIINGGYRLENLVLFKREADHKIPFFRVEAIDIGIDYAAILEGKLVCDVMVTRPEVNLVMAKTEKDTQMDPPPDFQAQLDEMIPLDLNHLEVEGGSVHFKDLRGTPKVDLKLTDMDVDVRDIRTRPGDSPSKHPTHGLMTARVEDAATVRVEGSADMFALPHPATDINISLKGLPLTKLNDAAQSYAKVDFQSGTFSLFGEVAVKNEKVTGYVKPIFRNLHMVGGKADEDDNVVEVAWEVFVSAIAHVFENHSKDQIATRIPINGSIKKADPDISATVMSLIGNAFLQALFPGVEGTVNLGSIRSGKGPFKVGKG